MVRLRADLETLQPYVPGRGEQEILTAYGLDSVVKLASNESPVPPFPEVIEAIAGAASTVNRYPETTYTELGSKLASHLGVTPDHLWFGGGGAELLREIALGVSGPGTSIVFPHPSFVVYGLAATIAGASPIPVGLDDDHRLDAGALEAAVQDDTTLVFVCNPNNPTGTHISTEAVADLLEAVPSNVLVVVDEAYLHYVAAPDYTTMVPLVDEYENLLVLHTFSKVYGLAGLRLGYVVGAPPLLAALRRVQLPFTANRLAQIAALEALDHQNQVAERVIENAEARSLLIAGLRDRGIPHADSQTNFVYCRLAGEPAATTEALLRRGVIVRPTPTAWTRVSVGTIEEIETFFTAYDDVGVP